MCCKYRNTNISKLLKDENIIAYALIESHVVHAIYIFRNTPSIVDNVKGVECIATINNCAHNDTFYNGFCSLFEESIENTDQILFG